MNKKQYKHNTNTIQTRILRRTLSYIYIYIILLNDIMDMRDMSMIS